MQHHNCGISQTSPRSVFLDGHPIHISKKKKTCTGCIWMAFPRCVFLGGPSEHFPKKNENCTIKLKCTKETSNFTKACQQLRVIALVFPHLISASILGALTHLDDLCIYHLLFVLIISVSASFNGGIIAWVQYELWTQYPYFFVPLVFELKLPLQLSTLPPRLYEALW